MSLLPVIDPLLMAAVLDALAAQVSIVAEDRDGSLVSRAGTPSAGPQADQPDRSRLIGRPSATFRQQLDAAAAGSVMTWEGWVAEAEGRTRYFQHVFAPAPNREHGDVLVITRDLTAQKAHERDLTSRIEALSGSQASSAAVVASSLDCIVIVDAEGCVVEFNPAAETTFGYARAATIGRPIADLIVPPSMRERHRHGMQRYGQTGVPHFLNRRVELEAMRADGSLFPVELSIVELEEAAGRFFAAHLRDLTIAKAAQREIERQRLLLHQRDKHSVMASLLSGVAHELNNPMAILLAQATLLQSRADTDDTRARAGKIHSAAERAARILKSFLTMARERPADRRPTDVRLVAEAAIEMTAHGRRSAGIDLLLDGGSGRVVADTHLLGQVVTTLLVNATQALSDRPGARKVWLTTRSEPDTIVLEIAHNGSDMPRNDDAAPGAMSRWPGLSMVRDIVASHGGTLEIGARIGGGVRFTMSLPAARETGDDDDRRAAGARDGLRTLIVDDEREVGEALADMLEIIGHRAILAHNAADALTHGADPSVDLVFADLRMPVISGIELYRHLVERRPELDGRFVLVTGDTLGALDAMRDGAPGSRLLVLEKPFSVRDVRAVLARAVLPGAAPEDGPRTASPGSTTTA